MRGSLHDRKVQGRHRLDKPLDELAATRQHQRQVKQQQDMKIAHHSHRGGRKPTYNPSSVVHNVYNGNRPKMENLSQAQSQKGQNKQRNQNKQQRKHLFTPEEIALMKTVLTEDETHLRIQLVATNVVTVHKETGELTLTSGGWRTVSTLGAINHTIRPLCLQVTQSGKDSNDWVIKSVASSTKGVRGSIAGTAASALQTFTDGVVVNQKSNSFLMMGRACIIRQHYTQTMVTLATREKQGKKPANEVIVPEGCFISKANTRR